MKLDFLPFNQKFLIPAAVVLLAALAGGYYFFTQYQTHQAQSNPQAQAQEEAKKLVEEVGKILDLPTGENPTVATITDITKLSDQPFFQKGKNGDKVLIYTNAGKAILYDPASKKVLDVAPVNIGTGSAEVASPSANFK